MTIYDGPSWAQDPASVEIGRPESTDRRSTDASGEIMRKNNELQKAYYWTAVCAPSGMCSVRHVHGGSCDEARSLHGLVSWWLLLGHARLSLS